DTRVDIKVVLLGKEYVGKTALVERFLHERFVTGHTYQSTIGAAYGSRRINTSNNLPVVLGIWDTAGSERYESMARIYYRGAGAAVICYDITDAVSLERAKFWTRELQKYEDRCKLYFCGCKRDLAEADPTCRQVGEEEVVVFAESIGGRAFETSSKTGENIDRLFRQIADDFSAEPSLLSNTFGGSVGTAGPANSGHSFSLHRGGGSNRIGGARGGTGGSSRCPCSN
ncbi:hypothetical protein BOX15_Mlig014634g1, partial [Macrostomum lignano]